MKTKIWGLLLIILGMVLVINTFDVVKINIFFDGWWTFFIIIPCLIDLFFERDKTGNLIGLLIGILLFLNCQEFISIGFIFKLLFPLILIIIGFSFIFKNNIKKTNIKENKNQDEYCSTFSVQNLDFSEEKFKGCDLTAIFGGIKADLSSSNVADQAVINISAIFGGVELKVPKDVKIIINQTCIFGGVSKKYQENKTAKKVIYLNVNCLFGGLDLND